jgi:hypothetical protein
VADVRFSHGGVPWKAVPTLPHHTPILSGNFTSLLFLALTRLNDQQGHYRNICYPPAAAILFKQSRKIKKCNIDANSPSPQSSGTIVRVLKSNNEILCLPVMNHQPVLCVA